MAKSTVSSGRAALNAQAARMASYSGKASTGGLTFGKTLTEQITNNPAAWNIATAQAALTPAQISALSISGNNAPLNFQSPAAITAAANLAVKEGWVKQYASNPGKLNELKADDAAVMAFEPWQKKYGIPIEDYNQSRTVGLERVRIKANPPTVQEAIRSFMKFGELMLAQGTSEKHTNAGWAKWKAEQKSIEKKQPIQSLQAVQPVQSTQPTNVTPDRTLPTYTPLSFETPVTTSQPPAGVPSYAEWKKAGMTYGGGYDQWVKDYVAGEGKATWKGEKYKVTFGENLAQQITTQAPYTQPLVIASRQPFTGVTGVVDQGVSQQMQAYFAALNEQIKSMYQASIDSIVAILKPLIPEGKEIQDLTNQEIADMMALAEADVGPTFTRLKQRAEEDFSTAKRFAEENLQKTFAQTGEDVGIQKTRLARNYQEAVADTQAALANRNLTFGGTRVKEERKLGTAYQEGLQDISRIGARTLESASEAFQRSYGGLSTLPTADFYSARNLGETGIETTRQARNLQDIEFGRQTEAERELQRKILEKTLYGRELYTTPATF